MDDDIFPFTEIQLKKLEKEIDNAGSFDKLMIQKKALSIKDGIKYISSFTDIEGYKGQFLTGVYKPLQEMYDTEIPLVFWSDMNDTLQRLKANKEVSKI